jgi:hypothetical protein
MNLSLNPPAQPAEARPPEDDLDGLLRDFFRAEMPGPWLPFQAPAPRRATLPRRFSLLRSRLALAASVALLVTGALLLSRSLRDETAGPNANGITRPEATDTRPTRPPRIEELIDVPPDGPAAIKVNVYEPLPPQ